jgi:protein gp37
MGDSKIEWTQKTWNPVTGCSKVSQGCKNCYAENQWPRLAANPKQPDYFGRAFTDVKFHPNRLTAPFEWKKPARIFVNSMSDLFHESLSWKSIGYVFAVMMLNPRHTFQVLTKRPERMQEFLTLGGIADRVTLQASEICETFGVSLPPTQLGAWPLPNVWLGVSVENQETAAHRIPYLLETPAAVRWISAEPLLGKIDIRRFFIERWLAAESSRLDDMKSLPRDYDCAIDWLVCGGESGPKGRPMQAEWAQSLRDQCVAAGVKYFFKQWGVWLPPGQDGAPGDGQHLNASDELVRIGKKAAGRLLDGVEWNQYPEAQA